MTPPSLPLKKYEKRMGQGGGGGCGGEEEEKAEMYSRFSVLSTSVIPKQLL